MDAPRQLPVFLVENPGDFLFYMSSSLTFASVRAAFSKVTMPAAPPRKYCSWMRRSTKPDLADANPGVASTVAT